MDKKPAIDYLNGVNWRHSRLGLERMEELLRRMGTPQNRLKCVHVAGTNGKGSTSAMLAGVLIAAGYKTGLYTSPYINHFSERMQVDGHPILDEELNEWTAHVRTHAEAMDDHPTAFELITAVAFAWFAHRGCDVVVLEVGLGGRLDATNVIQTPQLAIITPIDLDHTAELGDTLEQIAGEKAGVIKQGGTVVLYPPAKKSVLAVFEAACEARNARLTVADFASLRREDATLDGQRFCFEDFGELEIGLLGPYQVNNAALVLTAVRALRGSGWNISGEAVRQGLARTRWPARFELVSRDPAVIVDGGHNPQCARALMQALDTYFPGKRLRLVAGVMADKDYEATFGQLMPRLEQVYCVTPDTSRALPAEQLAVFFKEHGFAGVAAFESVHAAVHAALAALKPGEVICSFGSFYMCGAVRALFLKEESGGEAIN